MSEPVFWFCWLLFWWTVLVAGIAYEIGRAHARTRIVIGLDRLMENGDVVIKVRKDAPGWKESA